MHVSCQLESRAFNNSEVTISNSSCSLSACVVSVRPERGGARYTCEVSSEGPRFAVDKRSANMTLAGTNINFKLLTTHLQFL